jgi:hypothetical protein
MFYKLFYEACAFLTLKSRSAISIRLSTKLLLSSGSLPASFEYDYMLKDYLGNVSMVLTEEQQVDQYPAATMETAQTTTEESLYANLNTRY